MSKKVVESRHITMTIFLAAGIVLLLFGNSFPIHFIGGCLLFVGVLSSIK